MVEAVAEASKVLVSETIAALALKTLVVASVEATPVAVSAEVIPVAALEETVEELLQLEVLYMLVVFLLELARQKSENFLKKKFQM